jgi:hypothetical protein
VTEVEIPLSIALGMSDFRPGFDQNNSFSSICYLAEEVRIQFSTIESELVAFASGYWSPNSASVDVPLRRILNPIPIYSLKVNRDVPLRDTDIGFDLFMGDYVAPHGTGKDKDIRFVLSASERGKRDYDSKLTIFFSNEMDGISPFRPTPRFHGSTFRSDYRVPLDGFSRSWVISRTRHPGAAEQSNYDPQKHGYFFRIRTQVDANGKIVSANYGKIYGDFMNFTYYLNPTPNDRNIEFDPKRNLFTNLKPDERVTEP